MDDILQIRDMPKQLDPCLESQFPEVYRDPEANQAAAGFANLVWVIWQMWHVTIEAAGVSDYQTELDSAMIEQLKIYIWG